MNEDPSYCPFCGSPEIQFYNGLTMGSVDDPDQTTDLDEYLCCTCGETFYV